jgi:dUTP pyrophosphatase
MSLRAFVKRIPHASDLPLPSYESTHSAALLLHADTFDYGDGSSGYTCELRTGERILAMTGLHIAMPQAHVGLVVPLPDLALRHGITVLGAPNLLDAGFRGEVGVVLVNLGRTRFLLESGMPIARLVAMPVARLEIEEVPELP